MTVGLTAVAWPWARTVKSPNPAFAHVDLPLASTFMPSTKKGKEACVEPVVEAGGCEGRRPGSRGSRGSRRPVCRWGSRTRKCARIPSALSGIRLPGGRAFYGLPNPGGALRMSTGAGASAGSNPNTRP